MAEADTSSKVGSAEPRPVFYFARWMRWAGFALYFLSFLAPAGFESGQSIQFFGGASAFLDSPVFVLTTLISGGPVTFPMVLIPLALLLGWTANFTVFFRLPRGAALIAIALPWLPFFALFSIAAGFFPFYPWALGIALIHTASILSPKRQEPLQNK